MDVEDKISMVCMICITAIGCLSLLAIVVKMFLKG